MMSFGDMLNGGAAGGALLSQRGYGSPPGLYLGLQGNLDSKGAGDSMAHFGNLGSTSGNGRSGSGDGDSLGRIRELDENDSRSGGSDNVDGASGDDLCQDQNNGTNNRGKRKKRYHRHTPQQIQELENVFKECPHPDEKQRLELSRRLSLGSRQVKFWFQNRRTQMKMQIERHENTLLRQENDKLLTENMSLRGTMRNPLCTNCGSAAVIGEVSLEEQHLRLENARLKDELNRICALAGKFLGRTISPLTTQMGLMPGSSLELGIGGNPFPGIGDVAPTLSVPEFLPGLATTMGMVGQPARSAGMDNSIDRSVFLELALAAMSELMKIAQMEEPMWIPTFDDSMHMLNFDAYNRSIPAILGVKKSVDNISEGTKEVCIVAINSSSLVELLMDTNRWADMFSNIVTRAVTADIISNGLPGTRSGSLQIIDAELQMLSPLVPKRQMSFLRFCKQHAEGLWAVVDISVDNMRDAQGDVADGYMACRKFPSGCVIEDLPNGFSKVAWIEHTEYDESSTHQIYRQFVRCGLAFGARRWLATLQRHSNCLNFMISSAMSSAIPSSDHAGDGVLTHSGRRSMMKLAQRMMDSFFSTMSPVGLPKWRQLHGWPPSEGSNDMRIMVRQAINVPDKPTGLVLCATTSLWLPVSAQILFDYLCDKRHRSAWDIVADGSPMQEMLYIAKDQHQGNAVSLLRTTSPNPSSQNVLVLQETCTDSSCSMVVYSPVDVPAMHVAMSGGDTEPIALLPCGFAIFPDAQNTISSSFQSSHAALSPHNSSTGCLVTAAVQIVMGNIQTPAKLSMESVGAVGAHLSRTVQLIRAAFSS